MSGYTVYRPVSGVNKYMNGGGSQSVKITLNGVDAGVDEDYSSTRKEWDYRPGVSR